MLQVGVYSFGSYRQTMAADPVVGPQNFGVRIGYSKKMLFYTKVSLDFQPTYIKTMWLYY